MYLLLSFILCCSAFFDQHHQPSVTLMKVLSDVGFVSEDHTLETINAWAQKNLLRTGERWEPQTDRFEPLKPELLPYLSKLGFIDGARAKWTHYEGAIIYGGLLPAVCLRLQTLIDQWNEGVRFEHLYFLSGERPLNPESEHLPLRTEVEMVQWVWDQFDVPLSMRTEVKFHVICAPMKDGARPGTIETVLEWLKTNPPPGRYLGVSNGPYIVRQDLVAKMLSPKRFSFDTIGAPTNPAARMAIILDELARVIFLLKRCSDNVGSSERTSSSAHN